MMPYGSSPPSLVRLSRRPRLVKISRSPASRSLSQEKFHSTLLRVAWLLTVSKGVWYVWMTTNPRKISESCLANTSSIKIVSINGYRLVEIIALPAEQKGYPLQQTRIRIRSPFLPLFLLLDWILITPSQCCHSLDPPSALSLCLTCFSCMRYRHTSFLSCPAVSPVTFDFIVVFSCLLCSPET